MKKLLVVVLGLACILSENSFAGDSEKTEHPFFVGVILPFSSAFESIANEQKNAIEIALSGEADDLHVEFKDGGNNEEKAITAFKKLMEQERNSPQAVITCSSWASTAIHPLAAKQHVFHIAIGSAALERTKPEHTIRFTLDAEMEEKQLALYLSSFNRIAIFYMDNGYGIGWEKTIQNKFKDKIVQSLAYDPSATNFTSDLNSIKDANPDAILLLSAGKAAEIAKQARELGITAQFVGTRPIQRPELLKEYEYTKGLVYTYPSYDGKHPFILTYRNTYGGQPGNFAFEAYDAVNSLARALSAVGTSTERLFEWYIDNTWTGVLGEVRFNEAGDARYPYMFKEIEDQKFQIADFQFPLLLEKTRQEIQDVFQKMRQNMQDAVKKLSKTGIENPKTEKVLQTLYEKTPYAFDCATVNPEGIIVKVAPEKQKEVMGADISKQDHILRLHETHEPVFSEAFDTLEGFTGFDLEYPLFDTDAQFIGSVSILTKPDFFGAVISQKVANFPIEMWMMQKDGRIIYDPNEEEIGRNLFTDQLYSDHSSLLEVGRQMAQFPQGKGEYVFLDKGMERSVTKTLLWTTVALEGTQFRLALAYEKEEDADSL